MTPKEFAARISGRQYGDEVTSEERALAEKHGLVVVFGASDDLMIFKGAIVDDADCYRSGIAYLTKNWLFIPECDCDDCPYVKDERAQCKTIEAVWHKNGDPCWSYVTDIPHAIFNVYEGNDLYCAGIVFSIEELRG